MGGSYEGEADMREPAVVAVLQLRVEEVLLVWYMWIAWFRYYSSKYDLWELGERSSLAAAVPAQLASALPREWLW